MVPAESEDAEGWDFYLTRIDEHPASVAVDLGLARMAPLEGRTRLVCIRVKMRAARADGLSDTFEAATLAAIEEALVAEMKQRSQAIMVGRLTTRGRREWFFYGSTAEHTEAAIGAAVAPHPGYEASYRTALEPHWDTFFELLMPEPEEYGWMLDRRTVEALAQAGDRLSAPRPVDHHLGFGTRRVLEEHIAELSSAGFEAHDVHQAEDGRWCARLTRSDPVSFEHIHPVASELRRRARAGGGSYDGWGAPVVTLGEDLPS